MKILQVIPFFVPAWGFGGSVRLSYDLSCGLVKHGYPVTVLTTDAYDQKNRVKKICEKINGISIIRFKNISNKLAKRFNLYLPQGFKKYFEDHVKEYDIVHLHAFFTYQNVIASKICLKNNIPYVLHLTEIPIPEKVLGRLIPKKIFIRIFGRKILLGARKILVVSKTEKKIIAQYYPEVKARIEVVPIPIIGRQSKKTFDRAKLRAKYRFGQPDKLILSLSRLSQLKRIDLAIRAMAKLDNDFKLLVVGPDENGNEKKLKHLRDDLGLQKRVTFWGVRVGQEKDDLYSLADIYVLLSQYESASITTLEALQHNLPVCLSKNVGVADEVLRFNCGTFITEPENAQKSASELESAYNNRGILGVNCQSALKQFNMNNFINKVINIYKKVIKTGLES